MGAGTSNPSLSAAFDKIVAVDTFKEVLMTPEDSNGSKA
jgi:hypothetical protein